MFVLFIIVKENGEKMNYLESKVLDRIKFVQKYLIFFWMFENIFVLWMINNVKIVD